MNPAHTSPEPGLAPCGMKMEPVFAEGEGQTAGTALSPGSIKITPENSRLSGAGGDGGKVTLDLSPQNGG
jgi:hypothetical protein